MQVDFRRTTLAIIQQIQGQIDKLKSTDQNKPREGLIANIKNSIDLFKNDVILLLNQNFYLTCKMTEKDKIIVDLQRKLCKMEESSKLHLQMTKMKYEKYIHHLRY